MVPSKNHDKVRALGLLTLGLLTLGLLAIWTVLVPFVDLISGRATFAFRDVAHFYQPLTEYLHVRSEETSFPLWSSLDSFGVPLAGETTTALFYPPRILLAATLSPNTELAAYVLLHLAWAGFGVFRLTTGVTRNRFASAIAAFSYASSGPIFFLYTNPPFLVGASWLPWIFLFLIQSSHAQFPGAAKPLILAACSIAMSILGGDPQSIIHILLIWLLWKTSTFVFEYAKIRFRAGEQTLQSWRQSLPAIGRSLQSNGVKLGITMLVAIALAMPQLAAGISWSSQSHRSATRAESVYHWLGSLVSTSDTKADPIFYVRPHSDQVNDFSVAPWHLIELISPYVAGKPFPVHSRITKLLPQEPRMWTPTLYCGIFPGLCLLLTIFKPRFWSPWLSVAFVACGFALGQFGVYWLLVKFVPGYAQFRFPAKWLPLVALGLCIHCAHLLNFVKSQNLSAIVRALVPLFFAMTGLLAITLSPHIETYVISWLSPHDSFTTDTYWGPFQSTQWLLELRRSLLQTVCFLAISLIVCMLARRKKIAGHTMWLILLAMCMIESQLIASWQMLKIPSDHASSDFADSTVRGIATDSGHSLAKRYLLTQTENPAPASWASTSDENRAIEVQAFERHTWVSRWHLASGVATLNNPVSIPSHRSVLFWAALNHQLQSLPPAQQREVLTSIARYLSVVSIARRSQGELIFLDIDNSYPFARFHQRWIEREPISKQSLPDELTELLSRIIQNEEMLPLVEVASMVHPASPAAINLEPESPSSSPAVLSKVAVESDAFTIDISTERLGLLQLMQYQDGHWSAQLTEVETGQLIAAPVYRCDIISQAILVPKGNWQVRIFYNPGWFWPSIIVQITATIACLVILISLSLVRSRNTKQPSQTLVA